MEINCEVNVEKITIFIQRIAMKIEAEAIAEYTELIELISKSNLDELIKAEMLTEVEEFIADELNHQYKLHARYTKLSGIQAAFL